MPEILLCGFLSYNIAKLAKLKGQNAVVWVIITIAAFFMFFFASSFVMFFVKQPITVQDFTLYLSQNMMAYFTLDFVGMGGYLLVRYILEKMPNQKK